ncbi:MAG: B12-binding domain-containing radical SAM protein [Spirochaetales bacterium]|nr:B12-binding domain-containing radical SAM protein [Spirochaetales bacterium]
MKILFINPNFSSTQSSDAMEPLVFAILKGFTPHDIKCKLIDERVETIDFSEPADLVALSVQTFTAKRSYSIAQMFRKRGIPVVLGGIHPTLMPQEAKEFCDSVVIGDAETTWPEVIKDRQNNRLKPFYRSNNDYPLSGTRLDRCIFRGKNYTALKPVQFGRGCKYSCDFCSVHSVYGHSIRQNSIENALEDIRQIKSGFILFVDDNMFVNYHNTIDFFKTLAPLKKKWVCQMSIDAAYDRSLLRVMKKSGCVAVFIGFESFHPENLKQMNKTGNMRFPDYGKAVERIKEFGIMVCGSFIFGYDHDNVQSADRALSFAMKHKLCIAHFNPLFPAPGTPLYDRLKQKNRLLHEKWWLSDDYRYGMSFFLPGGMTQEELAYSCFSVRKKFNSYLNIIRRSFDAKANARSLFHLGAFWVSNMITRKEVYNKQGITLG